MGQAKPNLGETQAFPSAQLSSNFRAVDQAPALGRPQPCCGDAATLHSEVCSVKYCGIEGINPRTSFDSPDGEHRLVDVSGAGEEAVPWSRPPSLWVRSGSVVVQVVTSSSAGIRLWQKGGFRQVGSSHLSLFGSPAHTLPFPDSPSLDGAVPPRPAPHERATAPSAPQQNPPRGRHLFATALL